MIEQQQFLQERLLTGYCPDERERLEYTLYRIGDEVHPGEVIQEQYVCRNASQDEMGEILNSPKLIEATHQQMLQDSFQDRLDPKLPLAGDQQAGRRQNRHEVVAAVGPLAHIFLDMQL